MILIIIIVSRFPRESEDLSLPFVITLPHSKKDIHCHLQYAHINQKDSCGWTTKTESQSVMKI